MSTKHLSTYDQSNIGMATLALRWMSCPKHTRARRLTVGSCLAVDAAGMACRGPSWDSCWSQLLLPPLDNSCTLLVPSSLVLLTQPELIRLQAGLDQLHDQVFNCNRPDRRGRAICSAEQGIVQSADKGERTPAMASWRQKDQRQVLPHIRHTSSAGKSLTGNMDKSCFSLATALGSHLHKQMVDEVLLHDDRMHVTAC